MKIMDSITAINHSKKITDLIAVRNRRCRDLVDQYNSLYLQGKINNAMEIKRFIQIYWFDVQDQIEEVRMSMIKEQLQTASYLDKLNYMIFGIGVEEMHLKEISENERCPRGYLIIGQDKEIHISNTITTVHDLLDCPEVGQQFTVYREHEINPENQIADGKILYRIEADGRLKKIKENYKF